MLSIRKVFFIMAMAALPAGVDAATCSRANLTRCLDSACAINVSTNPAARCQYCGTASAGVPPTDNGMKAISVGASASNTLTSKQLQSAPTDPGQRYVWAATQCLKKVSGCTADDVEAAYDPLIEQSCKAAGVNAQMAQLQAAARKPKTATSCKTDVTACLVADARCTGDYRACKEDADFNKFFSECSVAATGCDEFLASIRTDLTKARDTAIKNADDAINQIVTAYQTARARKIDGIKAACRENSGREQCIATVCERNMPNQCAAGYESEKSMATQLCKFYDIACATVD